MNAISDVPHRAHVVEVLAYSFGNVSWYILLKSSFRGTQSRPTCYNTKSTSYQQVTADSLNSNMSIIDVSEILFRCVWHETHDCSGHFSLFSNPTYSRLRYSRANKMAPVKCYLEAWWEVLPKLTSLIPQCTTKHESFPLPYCTFYGIGNRWYDTASLRIY